MPIKIKTCKHMFIFQVNETLSPPEGKFSEEINVNILQILNERKLF